ncbi:MAG: alanine--tRNA ligase [Verrucomicrobiota bacterium]|nr:alanine--tRNA ligase [Verrucomicrobiota bacterium]
MLSREIRRAFLAYFKGHGHAHVPSSPVVPYEDPTLLFANAGMNQFKDIFLGKTRREYQRAVTTQKCIRVGGKHNDLENVGHTSRHLTFFEMLGNFSFGDYFKKEAIAFAWDVATHVFAFAPEKIWVSVYEEDDEAFALWEHYLPSKRIVRLGEKDNFWTMGETGPCGPCSELLYDRGDGYGPYPTPKEDPFGERYLEFWNLVFMQFDRTADGKKTPLPKPSIDTGAGLERVVSLRMGVENVFETDVLRALISEVERLSGTAYRKGDPRRAPPFHVIADHLRSLAFAVADGAQPSNIERGYVLRKLVRRAVRYGRELGLQKPFLADLLPCLVREMGEDFPEIKEAESRIGELLTLEEESFCQTLLRGGNLLQSIVDEASKTKRRIDGQEAFRLKDTYGFPLEEVLLIAKDAGLEVDLASYEVLEKEAKEKSRRARKGEELHFAPNFFSDFRAVHPPCHFEGYEKREGKARVTGLICENSFTDLLTEGMEGIVVLDRTPFYAEMGGQVGDCGVISVQGSLFRVRDTKAPFPGVIVHIGTLEAGELRKGELVDVVVDVERREEIEAHHTATHLLHLALQQVLGPQIRQAGSLVDAEHLRFDFTYHKAISAEELQEIEERVNAEIRANHPVKTYELSYEEAQKRTDIKQFFGEKYGERVRVVDAGISKELCGGTHVRETGRLGFCKVVKEGSIAAGVRRIEAVAGVEAEKLVQKKEEQLGRLAALCGVSPALLVTHVETLLEQQKSLEKLCKAYRKKELQELAAICSDKRRKVGGTALIAEVVSLTSPELPSFAEGLLAKLGSGVVAIGLQEEGRCQLLVAVSSDLVQKITAPLLIREAAPLIGGGGGGKPHLAQAGGKNPQGLPQALEQIALRLQNL